MRSVAMLGSMLRPIPSVVVEDNSGIVTSSTASITVAITAGSCAAAVFDIQ